MHSVHMSAGLYQNALFRFGWITLDEFPFGKFLNYNCVSSTHQWRLDQVHLACRTPKGSSFWDQKPFGLGKKKTYIWLKTTFWDPTQFFWEQKPFLWNQKPFSWDPIFLNLTLIQRRLGVLRIRKKLRVRSIPIGSAKNQVVVITRCSFQQWSPDWWLVGRQQSGLVRLTPLEQGYLFF